MSIHAPYRYDIVGSFLRPEYLRHARAEFEAGRLSHEALKEVEDRAITDLVNKEKAAGLHIITDGEFRRLTWHLDFMWGFQGVKRVHNDEGNTSFQGEAAAIDDVTLEGKVRNEKHPFVEHFRFLKQFEDAETVAKLTIPAPGQFYALFTGRQELKQTLTIYETTEAFAQDVVDAYKDFIGEVYAAGCRNLQLDDCTWGGFVNPKMAEVLSGLSIAEQPKYMETLVDINNRVIAGKPEDLTITTHACRGNYHSTFFSSGPYDNVAVPLFAHENVDAYYLEFDDARSGGFAPLKHVSGGKKVVLGLITTKRPELENKDEVIARIHEAAKYVPLDRLYLSPQCGFASCEIGNKLTEEEQWAKVKLVKEIAEEVWGKQ